MTVDTRQVTGVVARQVTGDVARHVIVWVGHRTILDTRQVISVVGLGGHPRLTAACASTQPNP
jgi:hypothetical protein